jgi:hypothetical protein
MELEPGIHIASTWFVLETECANCKACVEAKQVAVTGHPSDGVMTKISEFTLEGHVSLIS